MRFSIEQAGPRRWVWFLTRRDGTELSRSHTDYPSREQASAAVLAFAEIVAGALRAFRR